MILALCLFLFLFIASGWLSGFSPFFQPAQEAAVFIGDWQLVIQVDGQNFYLNFVLKETEGKLEGEISEGSGFFKNVPLTNIQREADRLHFEFTAPTPPDGLARLINVDLKLAEDKDKMEGTLYVADLEISALATATRQKF